MVPGLDSRQSVGRKPALLRSWLAGAIRPIFRHQGGRGSHPGRVTAFSALQKAVSWLTGDSGGRTQARVPAIHEDVRRSDHTSGPWSCCSTKTWQSDRFTFLHPTSTPNSQGFCLPKEPGPGKLLSSLHRPGQRLRPSPTFAQGLSHSGSPSQQDGAPGLLQTRGQTGRCDRKAPLRGQRIRTFVKRRQSLAWEGPSQRLRRS